MTRIIAGEFGGRRLVVPKDPRVRPTADRVREAWMSILADRLYGATVVDLFAGSGALGLEALSRGAKHVTFVEIAARSLGAIEENVAALGVGSRVTIHRGDALRFVERLGPGAVDIVLADPPFTLPLAEEVMERFVAAPFAKLLCIEHAAATTLGHGDTRRYGDIALTFCQAP
ncbi:MAG: 16S rRNA (guanine(966)-N(2))-methyltransferase RsmD [Gemmatimonadales bacterium]|nr:16S rRNA (guanine(966)-N(2))-methyltransferase RsmD [Gemmatimonadales bacterium]